MVKKVFMVLMAFTFTFGVFSGSFAKAVVEASSFSDQVVEQANADVSEGELSKAETTVAPILVWAAGVLAAAGLSWLAEKLLDWGAKKFCDTYGDSNATTKLVCDVIG